MGEETKVSSLGIGLIVLSTSSTILASICIVIYRESFNTFSIEQGWNISKDTCIIDVSSRLGGGIDTNLCTITFFNVDGVNS